VKRYIITQTDAGWRLEVRELDDEGRAHVHYFAKTKLEIAKKLMSVLKLHYETNETGGQAS
jgi:hypothetical protein